MNKEPERNPRKVLGKGLSALLPQRPVPSPPSPKPLLLRPNKGCRRTSKNFTTFRWTRSIRAKNSRAMCLTAIRLVNCRNPSRRTGFYSRLWFTGIATTAIGSSPASDGGGPRGWRACPKFRRSFEPWIGTGCWNFRLIENIQREDLNPIEIASAFYRLASHHGLSHEQIAERTGQRTINRDQLSAAASARRSSAAGIEGGND